MKRMYKFLNLISLKISEFDIFQSEIMIRILFQFDQKMIYVQFLDIYIYVLIEKFYFIWYLKDTWMIKIFHICMIKY